MQQMWLSCGIAKQNEIKDVQNIRWNGGGIRQNHDFHKNTTRHNHLQISNEFVQELVKTCNYCVMVIFSLIYTTCFHILSFCMNQATFNDMTSAKWSCANSVNGPWIYVCRMWMCDKQMQTLSKTQMCPTLSTSHIFCVPCSTIFTFFHVSYLYDTLHLSEHLGLKPLPHICEAHRQTKYRWRRSELPVSVLHIW